MKVCITEHVAPGFGVVPVGSLWADDSPYVVEADCFADVPEAAAAPVAKRVTRKFGQTAPQVEEAPE